MKKKALHSILILSILVLGCGERDHHNRTTISLTGFQNQKEVIYQTPAAEFYLGYNDLMEHCTKEDNGEPNDFVFRQIIDYIKSTPNDPIIVPDTLGTKMAIAGEILFNQSDSLIRIRDQNHPYAYVTERIRWIIIDFARKGKLKIFVKKLNAFVDTIIIDEVESNLDGVTNIDLTTGSTILSQLRWIQ